MPNAGVPHAKEVIKSIRRNNGADEDMLRTADDELTGAIKEMQANLGAALKSLSDELYAKDTHFIAELIQNCDDNNYPANVPPTLRLVLNDRYMTIECNEVGFTEENVRALCKVGASTKKDPQGYIGEKGIGFKSVFKVADVIYISSASFTFSLDKHQTLGMITPRWDERYPVRRGWTSFHLHFSLTYDIASLLGRLEDVKPNLLLFLRQLKSLTLTTNLPGRGLVGDVELLRKDDLEDRSVTIERFENDSRVFSQKLLLVDYKVTMGLREPKRRGIVESTIVLAFPLEGNGSPKVAPQDVHAFLPLRSFGFFFVIQADFLTSASREDILQDVPWNQKLRDSIPDAFVQATYRFKRLPSLELAWLRWLPQLISDPFFMPVETEIFKKLRNIACILCTDGVFRKPENVLSLAPTFLDSTGAPVLAPKHLPNDFHYLSEKYDIALDGPLLQRLGIKPMTFDHFIAGMQSFSAITPVFTKMSPQWHEDASRILLQVPRIPTTTIFPQVVQDLRIIPLVSGGWVTSRYSNATLVFRSSLEGLPSDLGWRTVDLDVSNWPYRAKLFSQLKVQTIDAQTVAIKVLELHSSKDTKTRSASSLLHDANFLFLHRDSLSSLKFNFVRMIDELGKSWHTCQLYMDKQLAPDMSLRDVFEGSPAPFLHPSFVKGFELDNNIEATAVWKSWLVQNCGVAVSPRLTLEGDLTGEFSHMLRTLPTTESLVVLKAIWSTIDTSLSSLGIKDISRTPVRCEDGAEVKLSSAALKRRALANVGPSLHFLPISDPDSPGWDFLLKLGVTANVDALFYLRRLQELQAKESSDRTAIEELYKQLDLHFTDNPTDIRQAFDTSPLLYVPIPPTGDYVWVSKKTVFWRGPPSMQSHPTLEHSYPNLQNFFKVRLGIEDADPAIILQELSQLAKSSGNRRITEEMAKRAGDILVDVADLAGKSPNMVPRVQQTCSGAVFPATFPGSVLRFAKLNSIYIPDPGQELAKALEKRVPLLHLSNNVLWKMSILFNTALMHHVKFLYPAVTKTIKPSGRQRFLSDMSRHYSEKAVHIERLVRAVGDQDSTPGHTIDVAQLLRLRRVQVSSVESITVSLSIEGKSVDNIVRVHIDDNDSGINILINQRLLPSSDAWDSGISGELANLLKIRPSELFCILTMPTNVLEELYFKPRGIPKYELAKEELPLAPTPIPIPIPIAAPKSELLNPRSPMNQTISSFPPALALQPVLSPSIIAPSEVEIPKDRWTQQWLDSQVAPNLPVLHQDVDFNLRQPGANSIPLSGITVSAPPSEVILSAFQDNTISYSTQHLRSPSQPTHEGSFGGLRLNAPSFVPPATQVIYSVPPQNSRIVESRFNTLVESSGDAGSSYNPDASRSVLETELSDMSISETNTSVSSTRSPRLRSRLEEWRLKRGDDDLSTIASPVMVTSSQLRSPSTQSRVTSKSKSTSNDNENDLVPEPRTPQTYADDILDQSSASDAFIKSEPVSPDRSLPKPEQQRFYAAEFSSNMSDLEQLGLQLHDSPRKDARSRPTNYSLDAQVSAQFVPTPHLLSLTPLGHENRPSSSKPEDVLVETSENTPVLRTHELSLSNELTARGIQFTLDRLRALPAFSEGDCVHNPSFESGYSPVDIMYQDAIGVLTEKWLGASIRDTWQDQWPMYLIKVVTTTGELKEPFIVSREEMKRAAELTLYEDVIPAEIYVLVRVAKILDQNPEWSIHVDPFRKIYDRRLNLVSKQITMEIA